MKANETTVVVPPKRAARVAPSGGCSHSSRPWLQPRVHRLVDVRVGLHAARQDEQARRVDRPRGLGGDGAGLGDERDPLARDADVERPLLLRA